MQEIKLREIASDSGLPSCQRRRELPSMGRRDLRMVQHGQFRYFRHLREPQVQGILTSSSGNV